MNYFGILKANVRDLNSFTASKNGSNTLLRQTEFPPISHIAVSKDISNNAVL